MRPVSDCVQSRKKHCSSPLIRVVFHRLGLSLVVVGKQAVSPTFVFASHFVLKNTRRQQKERPNAPGGDLARVIPTPTAQVLPVDHLGATEIWL